MPLQKATIVLLWWRASSLVVYQTALSHKNAKMQYTTPNNAFLMRSMFCQTFCAGLFQRLMN